MCRRNFKLVAVSMVLVFLLISAYSGRFSWAQAARSLAGHTDWVRSVAFSSDGRLLASGSLDQTIKLWDTATGSEIQALPGHMNTVRSVTFSPDGRLLASGSSDQTIKLWETATGREVRTLPSHKGEILSVAFSPDGNLLASGSCGERTPDSEACIQGEIRLWDLRSL